MKWTELAEDRVYVKWTELAEDRAYVKWTELAEDRVHKLKLNRNFVTISSFVPKVDQEVQRYNR